ncbi:RNA-guided endonuclease TnpB family protein, partial [Clostridioides difficile]
MVISQNKSGNIYVYSLTKNLFFNRNKARLKVARLQEHIASQRNDFLQKLSTKLIKENDIICIEDLQVKNMIRNRKLSRLISDVSWSEFIRQLEYKANWHGR